MPELTEAARRRAMRVLFCGVALGTTSFVVSLTVSPLAAEEITSSRALTGLPWTFGVLGTGIGSFVLSRAMGRRGRRFGLVNGYLVGAAGAVLALVAIGLRSLPLLVMGTFVFGSGNAANHLARYTASDLYPVERRGAALGTVAWAGTIGGVVGPNLLGPAEALAGALGMPDLAGPFLLTVLGFGTAFIVYVLFLRVGQPVAETGDVTLAGGLFASPRVQVAVVTLAAAQLVMVMIMSMTPVHLHDEGHGLATIGYVIGAHVFGMYGLSPVTGRLVDRYGSVRVIGTGFALLVAAAIAGAASPMHAGVALGVPLFVLGLGWNFSYVGGSALLTTGLSYEERTRVQGTTDAVVWASAATSSLVAGAIIASPAGYVGLCVVAAALVFVPVAVMAARRRSLAPVAAPA